jgi:hypothetical protein
VLWFNFRALSGAIDQVTDNDDILVGERERLLLGELQALLAEDGLLDADDTVIVAAREAYGKYLDHGIYACQPGRSFRAGLTHMGFYAGGAIRPEIPRILHRRDAVALTRAEADALRPTEPYGKRLADAIDVLLAADPQNEGNLYQLFVLTKADEESTVRLEAPIINDTVAKSGRAWAWTLGQRYTSLEGLKDPTVKATSDI